MTKTDDAALEDIFARIRAEDVAVSDALLDRIMLDAGTVLEERQATTPVAPRPGLGAMLLDAIGGWPSFSGLAAATVAGVWIGVAPPEAIGNLSASFWGGTIEVPLLESDALLGLEG